MVTVLLNGNAGSMASEEARDRVVHLIHSMLDDAEIVFTEEGSDVTALARQAVDNGSRMVVGGGGDGTLSAVAEGLVGTGRPMGILPLGTLNHFARDLGIPLDIESALQTLVTGRTQDVDIGRVNDRIFLNNSGLGLYPAIVRLRELKQREGTAKWPAALWATVKALARYERLGIRVSLDDGQPMLRRASVVFVGNNEYALENLRLPSRSRLTDGLLCVFIPRVHGPFKLIWFSLRALLGLKSAEENLDAVLTVECWIETRHRRLRISLDGEVVTLPTPLHYRVIPQALRVLVPAETPGP